MTGHTPQPVNFDKQSYVTTGDVEAAQPVHANFKLTDRIVASLGLGDYL